jgi:Helix-turn-helix domain
MWSNFLDFLASINLWLDGVKNEVQHLSRIRCRNEPSNEYQQLQPEERQTIASLHLQGSSIRAMARILGRSLATVSRELTRNSSAVRYASVSAKTLSVARCSAGRRPNKLCLQSVCCGASFSPCLVTTTDIGHTQAHVACIQPTRPARFVQNHLHGYLRSAAR